MAQPATTRAWEGLLLSVLGLVAACGAPVATPRPAPAPTAAPQTEGRRLRLPPRRADALTGSAFVLRAEHMGAAERETAIVSEILAGNVPAFERSLIAVELSAVAKTGALLRGRVFVTPDYLAIGSDDDFVRVPMTVRGARRIARETGTVLPTRHLVDAIQRQATVHLVSPEMAAGDAMGSVAYFVSHHRAIEAERAAQQAPLGALVSGPKKDVVISGRMLSLPGHTGIYGWFRGDGRAIQPLSFVHDDKYVDYAHGVRLVDGEMEVEGMRRPLLDVLAERGVAALISDEGHYDLRFVWAKGW